MEQENPVREKSYVLAVHVVKFCFWLQKERKEYIVSKQLLKSGTSIGANVEEAQQSQSRADFLSKMSIALKEAYESRFWLRLIRDTQLATSEQMHTLFDQVEELIRLLVSITMTSKERLRKQ